MSALSICETSKIFVDMTRHVRLESMVFSSMRSADNSSSCNDASKLRTSTIEKGKQPDLTSSKGYVTSGFFHFSIFEVRRLHAWGLRV